MRSSIPSNKSTSLYKLSSLISRRSSNLLRRPNVLVSILLVISFWRLFWMIRRLWMSGFTSSLQVTVTNLPIYSFIERFFSIDIFCQSLRTKLIESLKVIKIVTTKKVELDKTQEDDFMALEEDESEKKKKKKKKCIFIGGSTLIFS